MLLLSPCLIPDSFWPSPSRYSCFTLHLRHQYLLFFLQQHWHFFLLLVPPHPPILLSIAMPQDQISDPFSTYTCFWGDPIQSQGIKYHLYANSKFLSPYCAFHFYSRFVYPLPLHISTCMSNNQLKLKNIKIDLPLQISSCGLSYFNKSQLHSACC